MKKVLLPLAEGFEEIEAVSVIDLLRRASWEVTVAGFAAGAVSSGRNVRLLPDCTWDEVTPRDYDILVLPGGAAGVERLRQHAGVLEAVRAFDAAGKRLAAICAAPLVLQAAGVLRGRAVTCHPDVVSRLTEGRVQEQAVVRDGNLLTSRGAGTSLAFALALVAAEEGPERAAGLARAIVYTG